MKQVKTSTFNKVWCTFPEMIIRHLKNSEALLFLENLSTQEFLVPKSLGLFKQATRFISNHNIWIYIVKTS